MQSASILEQYDIALENKNQTQSSYLIFLAMMSLNIMLCTGVLSMIVKVGFLYTMAGTLVVPLWFTLNDIIAEVYGYKVAKKIIWFGFACQAIFGIASNLLIQLPEPGFAHNQHAYQTVLQPILHICASGFFAFIAGGFINIYLISKWKILLRGRYFWLRSLGASTISEFIFTVLAVLLIQLGKLPLSGILTIIITSYSLKVIYSIFLAYPANLLALIIKKADEVDVYDYNTNFNPFKFTD